jgi:hypothetical protein
MFLLDSYALEQMALVLGFGEKKYGTHNWRGGILISRLVSAALRHVFAFTKGETMDPESGLPHLAHASCCLMMAIWMGKNHPDLDDRHKIDETIEAIVKEAEKKPDILPWVMAMIDEINEEARKAVAVQKKNAEGPEPGEPENMAQDVTPTVKPPKCDGNCANCESNTVGKLPVDEVEAHILKDLRSMGRGELVKPAYYAVAAYRPNEHVRYRMKLIGFNELINHDLDKAELIKLNGEAPDWLLGLYWVDADGVVEVPNDSPYQLFFDAMMDAIGGFNRVEKVQHAEVGQAA